MSERTSNRSNRVRLAHLCLTVVLVSGIGSGACSKGSAKRPASPTSNRADDANQAAPLKLTKSQVDHAVGTSFQYGAFLVTVGHAVYDTTTKTLDVGLRFRNLADGWSQAAVAGTLELSDKTSVPFSGQPFSVPPGASSDLTGTAHLTTWATTHHGDPVASSRLLWGSQAFAQPAIAMNGKGGSNLGLPTPVRLAGWAHVGRFSVHPIAATLRGGIVEHNLQAPPGKRILHVVVDDFTTTGTINPFVPADELSLTTPDGTSIAAVAGSSPRGRLSWTEKENEWADFPVDAHANGDYQLVLAAMPKVGFGTIRPELIEHRPIPFAITSTRPTSIPREDLAVPDLTTPADTATGKAIDQPLHVGTVNIPGFLVRPERISWNPQTRTVTLHTEVTSLASLGPGGPSSLASAAGLSGTPTLNVTTALLVDNLARSGSTSGSTTISATRPSPITFTFADIRAFDVAKSTFMIGPSDGAVATVPLGPNAPGVLGPTAPVTMTASGPSLTAGSWSVQVRAVRVGRLLADFTPRPGMVDMEVTIDVTASASATKNAFGLSFSPEHQVLLAGPSGYDIEAIAGIAPTQQQPGSTVRTTVTFEVPDTFDGGSLGFVVRSLDEVGDLGASWIETRGPIDIGTNATKAALEGSGE